MPYLSFNEFMELKNSNAPTLTLAGITLFVKQWEKMFETGERYIVNFRTIYYLETANYKDEPKIKVRKVWEEHGDLPLTKRGRFVNLDCKGVNHLLGQEIFAY